MDELRGPTIQVILHIKEGLGFGFLRCPFIVSGSLNGYMLETDPVVPCHAPVFDAELVWEADKRRFRSLRVQNVPIKVEVYGTGTQGRKDKVGYFLLSLLGAQPRPSNKVVEIKHSWHRLLGVKSEGKCCQPQLLMSLSIEDRVATITPRNELRLFHSNEVAYPTTAASAHPTARSMHFTIKELVAESSRVASSAALRPRLLCDEGLIQVGGGRQLFVLRLGLAAIENLDLLLGDYGASKEPVDCYVSYSVFTHDIQTDRVASTMSAAGSSAHFNQRTSLRLRSSLAALGRYFAECPHLVARVCARDSPVGICSLDLRKLIPTESIEEFTRNFCNMESGLTIHERCFILRCDERAEARDGRRPYVDVEMTLQYLGEGQDKKPTVLSARSATVLEASRTDKEANPLHYRAGSYTDIAADVGDVAYTNMGPCNTARYKTATGDAMIQTNAIADMIKQMYESFKESQEKLLSSNLRPTTSDMQVQCEPECSGERADKEVCAPDDDIPPPTPRGEEVKLEISKSDSFIGRDEKEYVKQVISPMERSALMQKCVEELEDWKEKQQDLFKIQLKRKEEYHLDMLAREWSKKQVELECKLSKGIEQCRQLAADLSRATEDFRLRGFRNTERERKLSDAKKALEAHYTAKYQELRIASQKMEDDMHHQIKLKDMRIEELEMKVAHLEKQVDELKNNQKESDNKYSGLTKDQTASLIQELRCLEEKLDSAVQSKAFFKEQWGRAVRELHLSKLNTRRQMLSQLQQDRRQLGEMGLDTIHDERSLSRSQQDIKRLKDDFYVDLLAHSPGLDATSVISSSGPEGMDTFGDNKSKNPVNSKLGELISQRDRLVQQAAPDERLLQDLNKEIRSMLLHCAST